MQNNDINKIIEKDIDILFNYDKQTVECLLKNNTVAKFFRDKNKNEIIELQKDNLKYVGLKDGYGIVMRKPKESANKYVYYGNFDINFDQKIFKPKKDKKYDIEIYNTSENGDKNLFEAQSLLDENFVLNDKEYNERYIIDWGYGEYSGVIKDDKKVEKCTIINRDGFYELNLKNGDAFFVEQKGSIYMGKANGKLQRHGEGTLLLGNGVQAEGSFFNGVKEGKVEYKYIDGDRFIDQYHTGYNVSKKDKIKKEQSNLIIFDETDVKEEANRIETRKVKYFDVNKDKKKIKKETYEQKKDKHVKIIIVKHGYFNESPWVFDRSICFGEDIDNDTVKYLNSFKENKDIKSFYISSHACKGALSNLNGYSVKDIIEDVVKNTNNCIGFVSFAVSEYGISSQNVINKNSKIGLKRFITNKPNDKSGYLYHQQYVDLNKDHFFKYYCCLKHDNKIKFLQIPHDLCYWREYLIDNGLFKDALDTVIKDEPYTFKYKYVEEGEQKEKEITISNFKEIKLSDIADDKDLLQSFVKQIKNSNQSPKNISNFLQKIKYLKDNELFKNSVIRYYKGEISYVETIVNNSLSRLYMNTDKYQEDMQEKKWYFFDNSMDKIVLKHIGNLDENNKRYKYIKTLIYNKNNNIDDENYDVAYVGGAKMVKEGCNMKVCFDGKGCLNLLNNKYHKGEFKDNDLCNGELYREEKGGEILVQVKNFKFEGEGDFIFNDGLKFKGIWKEGFIQSGKYYDINGVEIADFILKHGEHFKYPEYPKYASLKILKENTELKEKNKILEDEKIKKSKHFLEYKIENNAFTINVNKKNQLIKKTTKNNNKNKNNNLNLPFIKKRDNLNIFYREKMLKYKNDIHKNKQNINRNNLVLPIISNYKNNNNVVVDLNKGREITNFYKK